MRAARPLRAALLAVLLAAGLACASPPVERLPPRIAPGTGPAAEPVRVPGPCDPCVLLLHDPLDDLVDGEFCRRCGDRDPGACAGFPHGPPVRCEELDRLRNCIYARLGYDFEDAPEWRGVFEQEGWYRPDPEFRWSRVTPLQADNARALREIVHDGGCVR